MGLTIHYSGTLTSEDLLQPLIEEVSDICKSLDWKSTTLTGMNDDDHLKGVCFSPENSEPVFSPSFPEAAFALPPA